MPRILITSGPTRQYLDPVRFLSNASSGRMGAALARAAIDAGFDVTIVTGPVAIEYPGQAKIVRVVSTDEMLQACLDAFDDCVGLIAAAAPCDYRPVHIADQKLSKTGERVVVELEETPDIVATLAARKANRWIVAFALETQDHRAKALDKLTRKNADLIVVNGPTAIDADATSVEILDRNGQTVAALSGDKGQVAHAILAAIAKRF